MHCKKTIIQKLLILLFFGFCWSYHATAQNAKLKGTVITETGTPLTGVTVEIKTTKDANKQTTATNEKGVFAFTHLNTGNKYNITLSFVGYETYIQRGIEVSATEEKSILIRLKQATSNLNDVVVVGYGTQKRSNITGAVNQVGSEAFENKPVTNAAQALQGVIPNLNVTFADGRPDKGGTFNIRGFTSINGGGPLILIDGIPGDINQINPEDIDKISVLKDAASAAIYGARGAFGVVMVTTKNGKKGKLDFRYSNNFGVSQPLGVPKVTNALTDATIQDSAYRGATGTDYPGMPLIIAYLQQRQANPSLPELGLAPTGTYLNGANNDWYGLFYKKNLYFNKNYVSVSGGDDKVTCFLSGSYGGQDGIFAQQTDQYKRYNLREKLNIDLKPWIALYNNGEFDEGDYSSPNTNVNAAGNDIYRYLSLFANPYNAIKTADGSWTQAGALTFGQLRDGGRNNTQNRTIRNTSGLKIKLLNNQLHINADYSVSYNTIAINTEQLQVTYESQPNTFVLYPNPNLYSSSAEQDFHSVANLYADYSRSFGKHNFTLLGGASQEIDHDHYFIASKTNNITPSLGSLNLTSGVASVSDSYQSWALQSLFYRANYNYDSKYLLELNGRYDGSSRFPPNDRFGFFPSVSGGWVVSREKFFKPLTNVINNFKLRASYGSLGNQQVSSAYPYISTMNVTTGTVILNGALPLITSAPGLVSPSLTWETSRTVDVGTDMLLLRNRLELGFDWYNRQTLNMLTAGQTLPAVLGTVVPLSNAANLSTKGFEFSSKWSDRVSLAGQTFGYSISAILSSNHAIVTKYSNPTGLLGNSLGPNGNSTYYVGEKLGEIWGYKTLGFFKTNTEYLTSPSQSQVSVQQYGVNGHCVAGDVKFADINGDGVINNGTNTLGNHGDLMRIGNTTPKYSYGFNLGINWKGIDISAFFQGVGRRAFWPGPESGVFWGPYNRQNQPVYDHIVNNFWTPTNTNAYFPRLVSSDAQNPGDALYNVQTRYLQNAAYLRLKNITVGYKLPASLVNRIRMSSIRVFVSGQNLVTWTKLSKAFDPEGIAQDPESPATNGNGFVYPLQRTFVGGIEVKF